MCEAIDEGEELEMIVAQRNAEIQRHRVLGIQEDVGGAVVVTGLDVGCIGIEGSIG